LHKRYHVARNRHIVAFLYLFPELKYTLGLPQENLSLEILILCVELVRDKEECVPLFFPGDRQ
jgi:hypothetical protein